MFQHYGPISSSFGRTIVEEVLNLSLNNGIVTASYLPLVGERNKPPIIEDVVVTTNNNYSVGSVLTATITGRVNGPFAIGTHVYQWYRLSALYNGTLTAIAGATNSTYTLVAGDVNSYIVCEARFVQVDGANTMSGWYRSLATAKITSASLSDINHNWEHFFNIESGESIPANWNDSGVSPTLTNLATGGVNWTATSTTKPTYDSVKASLVFANAHKVTGDSSVHPPEFEIWVKGKFTANNGAMIGWGSQTIFGITSGGLFYIRDTSNTFGGLGDFNEHVWRIVLTAGTNACKFQMDKGTEYTFTSTFTSAQFLALGQTYSGANPSDCEIKRFQRTHDGAFLTAQEVTDKWAYHGFP